MTAAGDIIYGGTSGAPTRLAAGTAGQVLKMNSGATAPEWGAASGGGFTSCFRAYRNTSAQTISSLTWTKIQLNAESFDVDSEFDPSTNYRFTPASAGYYFLTGKVEISISSGERVKVAIYKNGTAIATNTFTSVPSGQTAATVTDIVYSDGNDYFELYVWHTDASSKDVQNGDSVTYLSGHRLS